MWLQMYRDKSGWFIELPDLVGADRMLVRIGTGWLRLRSVRVCRHVKNVDVVGKPYVNSILLLIKILKLAFTL